jgi:transposase, IS5 family
MIKQDGQSDAAEVAAMSYVATAQMSLAEELVARRAGQNERLAKIDGLLSWKELGGLLKGIHAAAEGRPAYPPLTMVKALLLQQWHSLSDPELEEALADRLSFRRFVGLGLEQEVPDHSTICRFRQELEESGRAEKLFAEVNRQLDARGLVLKRGTLIDATVVGAAVSKPAAGADKRGLGQGSALDPDAQWTHRKGGGGSHFGYKVHVAVDLGSNLIRKARMTGAKVNDTEVADELICRDQGAVLADKAYDSAARRALLARLGIADGIMRRAWWGTARDPDPQLVARNRTLSCLRSRVEQVFGVMKRSYNYRRVRYLGLARNSVQMFLLCTALNLRRALILSAA